MNKEFKLNDRRFIVNFENNDIRIYLADKHGNPSLELSLTLFNDLKQEYVSYDLDKTILNLINNFNQKYPVLKVSISEKLIITEDYNIYLLFKNNNLYSIRKIPLYDILDEKINYYKQLLYQLLNGNSVSVKDYILSSNYFYQLLNEDVIINDILDEEVKEVVIQLLNTYKKLFGEVITNKSEGGTGNENAKVKVKKAGYISKLFIICLSFFSIGVFVALMIVIINKFIL